MNSFSVIHNPDEFTATGRDVDFDA